MCSIVILTYERGDQGHLFPFPFLCAVVNFLYSHFPLPCPHLPSPPSFSPSVTCVCQSTHWYCLISVHCSHWHLRSLMTSIAPLSLWGHWYLAADGGFVQVFSTSARTAAGLAGCLPSRLFGQRPPPSVERQWITGKGHISNLEAWHSDSQGHAIKAQGHGHCLKHIQAKHSMFRDTSSGSQGHNKNLRDRDTEVWDILAFWDILLGHPNCLISVHCSHWHLHSSVCQSMNQSIVLFRCIAAIDTYTDDKSMLTCI